MIVLLWRFLSNFPALFESGVNYTSLTDHTLKRNRWLDTESASKQGQQGKHGVFKWFVALGCKSRSCASIYSLESKTFPFHKLWPVLYVFLSCRCSGTRLPVAFTEWHEQHQPREVAAADLHIIHTERRSAPNWVHATCSGLGQH